MRSVRLLPAAVLAASLVGALDAHARSSGGSFMSACNGCHQGGATPAVTFLVGSVPAASAHANRGQTLSLGFAITSPNTAQRRAGFSVTSPLPVTAGAGVTAVVPSTVQHTSPRISGGSRNEFRFYASIPAAAACGSIHTFTGWGSATNGDGSTAGDGSARGTLAVTVDCPPSLVPGVQPADPGAPAGPIALPQLAQGDASQVLLGWLQSSNHYRMSSKNFATRNARLVDRDWVFDLVLQCCAASQPIDVWRVDSATKQVTRQAAGGVFIKP